MSGAWDLPCDPLVALRGGNPRPFEDFVRSHTRVIVAFFRRQGLGLEHAEDLTQDVMLKLHRNAHRYRPQERFAAYCLRVAHNQLVDARRRRPLRRVPLESVESRPPGALLAPRDAADPLDEATRLEDGERLRAALAGTPEHHRLVLELGALEGLSYAEIGSILSIPVGTVKSRMFHALRRLRKVLEAKPTPRAAREEDGSPR